MKAREVNKMARSGWVIALVAVLALVAACSSSKSGGTTSGGTTSGGATSGGSTVAKATGSPLNVMTIAPVDYQGPSFANVLDTAKVSVSWINDHGGVNGHPLKLTTCDDHGIPTTTVQCGQQAVADHAVAVIGSFTYNGDALLPILQAANISYIGGLLSGALGETSPIVQEISGIGGAGAGLIVQAVQDGCKNIAQLDIDLGSASDGFMDMVAANAVKALGAPKSTIAKYVTVPLKVTDYSPQVVQATSGTDCIVADLSENQWASFMPAFVSTGAHQRLYGYQGNLDITVTKAFPAATQNAVIVGSYSDISLPAWDDFRAALTKYNAPTNNVNYNSLSGLGGWAAFAAFKQIAGGLTGPITSDTFLAAAQKATVNLPGVPKADFADKWTGFGGSQANSVSRSITYSVVQNGVPKAINNGQFFDMTNAMLGLPMLASEIPPRS